LAWWQAHDGIAAQHAALGMPLHGSAADRSIHDVRLRNGDDALVLRFTTSALSQLNCRVLALKPLFHLMK
jgi:hypothetical protein